MDTLSELYHRGVDFVDISAEIKDGQDTIGLVFSKSYMDPEYVDNFDNFEEEQVPSKISVKLSEEDLDQLI